jgi:hypothetical protein
MMSRARAIGLLAIAAVAAGIALELPWFSVSGPAEGTTTPVTMGVSGGAALPWAVAWVLLVLITLVGTWVLPWWMRIAVAAVTAVVTLVVAFLMVRLLITPDLPATLVDFPVGDAATSRRVPGPGLMFLALGVATTGLRGVLIAARTWPGLAPRYERRGGADPWSQLDRGIDPTDS